jgi:hypothetical protein
MIHVGLHSVGTYHKKFGRQNKINKNILCRVFRDDTRQSLLGRVPTTWHSAKKTLCRVPTVGSRQRLTAVNFWTAADGPLPRAPFTECLTLGKGVFAEWGPVPSVQHSVKRLFAESLTLPRAALGKAVFAECSTKGTRQRGQHSEKPRIPVVTPISTFKRGIKFVVSKHKTNIKKGFVFQKIVTYLPYFENTPYILFYL